MERDGVPRRQVLATSVTTGARRRRAAAAARQRRGRPHAAQHRLAGDVRMAAGALTDDVAAAEAGGRGRGATTSWSTRSPARPACPPSSRRSSATTAKEAVRPHRVAVHPVGAAPRPDRCDGCGSTAATPSRRSRRHADVRSVLGRSSLPPPTPAARAAVDLATRRLADRAADGLPTPWAEAVERRRDPAGPGARRRPRPGGRRHLALSSGHPCGGGCSGRSSSSSPRPRSSGLLWLALLVVLGWLQLDRRREPPTLGRAAGAGRPARSAGCSPGCSSRGIAALAGGHRGAPPRPGHGPAAARLHRGRRATSGSSRRSSGCSSGTGRPVRRSRRAADV